jgi:hypothetical protein
MQSTFQQSQPVAQGAVEVGEFVVLFRVMPRGAAGGELPPPDGGTPPPPIPFPPGRRRSRRGKR